MLRCTVPLWVKEFEGVRYALTEEHALEIERRRGS